MWEELLQIRKKLDVIEGLFTTLIQGENIEGSSLEPLQTPSNINPLVKFQLL